MRYSSRAHFPRSRRRHRSEQNGRKSPVFQSTSRPQVGQRTSRTRLLYPSTLTPSNGRAQVSPMPAPGALAGLTVVTFETRRGDELARLLERHDATVVRAPALREVPLSDAAPARALADALQAGHVAALVLLTGVGTRGLVKVWGDAGLAAPPLL